jgi:hypothetical protein
MALLCERAVVATCSLHSLQVGTVSLNAMQYNAIQYNTIQYNTCTIQELMWNWYKSMLTNKRPLWICQAME